MSTPNKRQCSYLGEGRYLVRSAEGYEEAKQQALKQSGLRGPDVKVKYTGVFRFGYPAVVWFWPIFRGNMRWDIYACSYHLNTYMEFLHKRLKELENHDVLIAELGYTKLAEVAAGRASDDPEFRADLLRLLEEGIPSPETKED